MKNLKQLLNPFLYITIGYIIVFNLYMFKAKNAFIFSVICGLFLYFIGTYIFIQTKGNKKISLEVYQHYKSCGLTDRDIQFFRERLIYLTQNAIKIKEQEEKLDQLIGKENQDQLFQVIEGIYEELILMPKKLIMIDDFLYQSLPNCLEGIDEKNGDKINEQLNQMIVLYQKMNQDDFEAIELEYLS